MREVSTSPVVRPIGDVPDSSSGVVHVPSPWSIRKGFVYPGDSHLFADASLPSYNPAAAAALVGRVLDFLESLE